MYMSKALDFGTLCRLMTNGSSRQAYTHGGSTVLTFPGDDIEPGEEYVILPTDEEVPDEFEEHKLFTIYQKPDAPRIE